MIADFVFLSLVNSIGFVCVGEYIKIRKKEPRPVNVSEYDKSINDVSFLLLESLLYFGWIFLLFGIFDAFFVVSKWYFIGATILGIEVLKKSCLNQINWLTRKLIIIITILKRFLTKKLINYKRSHKQ